MSAPKTDPPVLSDERKAEVKDAIDRLEIAAEYTGAATGSNAIKANSALKRAARARLYRLLGIDNG